MEGPVSDLREDAGRGLRVRNRRREINGRDPGAECAGRTHHRQGRPERAGTAAGHGKHNQTARAHGGDARGRGNHRAHHRSVLQCSVRPAAHPHDDAGDEPAAGHEPAEVFEG